MTQTLVPNILRTMACSVLGVPCLPLRCLLVRHPDPPPDRSCDRRCAAIARRELFADRAEQEGVRDVRRVQARGRRVGEEGTAEVQYDLGVEEGCGGWGVEV